MKAKEENPILNEVVGIILLGVSILLGASLLTYDAYDTQASPPNQPLHNLGGILGAYLGDWLYLYLGWAALLLPLVSLYWGIRKILGDKRRIYLMAFGLPILILSTSSLFSVGFLRDHLLIGLSKIPAGGLIGSLIGDYLITYLGRLSWLLSLIGIILGYTLTFNYSITNSLRLREIHLKRDRSCPQELTDMVFTSRPVKVEDKPRIVLTTKEKETITKQTHEEKETLPYELPSLSLLDEGLDYQNEKEVKEELLSTSKLLKECLSDFGVEAKIVQVSQGPTVTRFELQPAPGVKVAKIISLLDDIALALATPNVRVETPIPGKQAIGIEIPNKKVLVVHLREILESSEFINSPSKLTIGLGKDVAGHVVVIDLAQMPHLLIAGATGGGKSICINTIITSILYRAAPSEVKLLLIDPKRVEFTIFKDIPHLISPVINDAKKSATALRWLINEMEERYKRFAHLGVRDIEGYNRFYNDDTIPYIVVIIDELADLMMVAMNDCEEAIIRLAQLARAVGIHLVLATQRPSVDVITGLIKANLPSRIAFQVSSKVDSRTILDMNGAEILLGAGDMLFAQAGAGRPIRVKGSYISREELERVVEFIRAQGYKQEDKMDLSLIELKDEDKDPFDDELYKEALMLLKRHDVISVSMLQRRLRIGYNRAARLIEALEEEGIVGPQDGVKPRRIYHDKIEARKAII